MGGRSLKFIRWKYVLPRLVLLFGLVLSVRLGLDPLLHWAIVTSGQAAVGAKVEIAELKTSLREGHLVLTGLQVADPNAPLSNLLQSERVDLKLDTTALLHQRLHVKSGEIHGLQFGTTRETSGTLEVTPDAAQAPSQLAEKASALATDWLDQVQQRLETDFTDQLQTYRLAIELEARWKERAAALRARGKDLMTRGKQLEVELREVKSNPLRGLERLPELESQLKTVRKEFSSLQKEIKSLPAQVEADRQSLLAARQADEAFLRQQLNFDRLDGNNLNQVLLGQSVTTQLQSALDWIAWIRNKLPSNSAKQIAAARRRGATVYFGTEQPKVLIKSLALDLSATIEGRTMQFRGSLTNASSAPRLLAEPARLELASSGDLPMNLTITSDRRTELTREELSFLCPTLPIETQQWGNPEKLVVHLEPGTAELAVNLQIVDDELHGHIMFHQEHLVLAPQAGPRANATLATALAQALGNVNKLSATVDLAGTLQRPEFQIHSQLGEQLAAGISTAVVGAAREKGEALLAGVTDKANRQLTKLTESTEGLRQELLAKLGENQKLFDGLATLGGNSQGLPVPQLGALGTGILRK